MCIAERGRFHRYCALRHVGDQWAFLHVFVSAAAFETDGASMISDLSPFLAPAFNAVAMDGPQLFCLNRR
jgi:hypothetical protein